MPKRGQTQDWRVRFQYPDQPVHTRPYGNGGEAEAFAEWVAQRGAHAELLHVDPRSGERTLEEVYRPEDYPADDDHLLCLATEPSGTSHAGQSEDIRCDQDAAPGDDFCAKHRTQLVEQPDL